MAYIGAYLEAITRFAPDVILYDVFSLTGYVAGRHLGTPLACSVPIAGFGALGDAFVTRYRDAHSMLTEANRFYLDSYGVDILGEGHLPVLFPSRDLSIVTALESASVPIDGQHNPQLRQLLRTVLPACRYVGPCVQWPPHTPESAMSDFPIDRVRAARAAGRRVVLFALGTELTNFRYDSRVGGAPTGHAFLRALLHRLVEAFGDDPRILVVAATGALLPPQDQPDWPANFIASRFIPQAALLDRYVDVFVTHHGLNSTAESILAGVPMVSVPGLGDQILNARTAGEQGTAVALWDLADPYHTCDSARLRGAVYQAMDDPRMRAAGDRVRSEIAAAGGATAAARLVMSLSHRRPSAESAARE